MRPPSLCLLMTEKGYKLIVFKCDMPLLHRGAQEHTQGKSAQYARHGVLGCLDVVRGSSLDELSQDYAARTCEKIMKMVSLFATPFGEGSPDATICENFGMQPGVSSSTAR